MPSSRSSRIARAVAGREAVTVYTTDSPMAYRFAGAVHSTFGGSLIPYDRLSRAADDFADLLVQNSVERSGRKRAGQAVLVVIEGDLTLPFLRRTTGLRTSGGALDDAEADGFVIAVAAAGKGSVTRLPD